MKLYLLSMLARDSMQQMHCLHRRHTDDEVEVAAASWQRKRVLVRRMRCKCMQMQRRQGYYGRESKSFAVDIIVKVGVLHHGGRCDDDVA